MWAVWGAWNYITKYRMNLLVWARSYTLEKWQYLAVFAYFIYTEPEKAETQWRSWLESIPTSTSKPEQFQCWKNYSYIHPVMCPSVLMNPLSGWLKSKQKPRVEVIILKFNIAILFQERPLVWRYILNPRTDWLKPEWFRFSVVVKKFTSKVQIWRTNLNPCSVLEHVNWVLVVTVTLCESFFLAKTHLPIVRLRNGAWDVEIILADWNY